MNPSLMLAVNSLYLDPAPLGYAYRTEHDFLLEGIDDLALCVGRRIETDALSAVVSSGKAYARIVNPAPISLLACCHGSVRCFHGIHTFQYLPPTVGVIVELEARLIVFIVIEHCLDFSLRRFTDIGVVTNKVVKENIHCELCACLGNWE